MRILILTPEFPPEFGGIGTHCYEMAKHWSRQADVTVLAPAAAARRGGVDAPFRVVGMRPTPSRLVRLLRSVREIVRLMTAERFDAVYVAHWRTCGVAFRIASALCRQRPRYVQAIHGGEVLYIVRGRTGPFTRHLFLWTTARADRLIALGRYQAELLEQLGIGPERVYVSPEGVDLSTFERTITDETLNGLRQRHRLEGKRVLLTVARLAPHKGHDMVIRALPRILARVPDTAYLIVGSGATERALRRLAEELGVGEHVRFAGFVAEHELAGHYHVSDVFIMPSRELDGDTEGFGIVFAEAAACGRPTIGGRTGGIVEAVEEGRTGLLVDPTSTDEIVEAAVRLLSDREMARRMGEAGRSRVIERMQYKDIAANILTACCERTTAPVHAA
jgi:phosphatidylinositol alpha-1,6-mannosyltransferase